MTKEGITSALGGIFRNWIRISSHVYIVYWFFDHWVAEWLLLMGKKLLKWYLAHLLWKYSKWCTIVAFLIFRPYINSVKLFNYKGKKKMDKYLIPIVCFYVHHLYDVLLYILSFITLHWSFWIAAFDFSGSC